MAVPRERMDDDEEEGGALFEEEGVLAEAEVYTPPHLQRVAAAVEVGDVHALRQALDDLHGSIDEPVEDGDTALHLTCLYGYLSCVQLLLERGASLEVRDEDGAIPLHDACAGGFTEIVQLIINHANSAEFVKRMLEAVDVEGDTQLGKSNGHGGTSKIAYGCRSQVGLLWKNIFELRSSIFSFVSSLPLALPLHHAARGEHVEVIRLLLAAGASPTTTNIYGKVPSELADPDTQAKTILEAATSPMMC